MSHRSFSLLETLIATSILNVSGHEPRARKTAGFSLLETLIATAILIIVVLAVTSLSNSLIAGTVVNADKTVINRWAAEGVELTQKIRDDNLLNKATATSTTNWFAPAVPAPADGYGWHKLSTLDRRTWTLILIAGDVNLIDPTSEAFATLSEPLTSDATTGYRLICVEAVGAVDNTADNALRCNTDTDNNPITDGSRLNISLPCQDGDLYCSMTQASVNKNRLVEDNLIPPGNAVKVRSVVVWQDKDQYRTSSIATLLTNWKSYVQ